MPFTNAALATCVFVLSIIGQLRCATTASLRSTATLQLTDGEVATSETGSESGEFLDAASELETSALMKRVVRVQTVAATQEYAVQAQQQALVGLEREQEILASRLTALEAPDVEGKVKQGTSAAEAESEPAAEEEDPEPLQTKKKKEEEADKEEAPPPKPKNQAEADNEEAAETPHFLCSDQTALSCGSFHGFGGDSDCATYGEAECQNTTCACKTGFCADGHGKCKSKKPAQLLPDIYEIEVHADLGSYVQLQKDDKKLDFSTGEPGKRGRWQVVVNTDDSLMLYTREFGPDHFMSLIHHEGKFDSEFTEFTSPREASFEIYEDKRKLIYLKDVATGMWMQASKKMGGNSILGRTDFPGESGALIFHPPLKVKMMKASARSVWPLLPFLLLIASAFGQGTIS